MCVLTTGLLAACSHTPEVSAADVSTACGFDEVSVVMPLDEITVTERQRNADKAVARVEAAQRVAAADGRFAPLAEALGIISDAARTLNSSPDGVSSLIDWDLVKLAQAAAADQCELLVARHTQP